jgi:hypothetical protein
MLARPGVVTLALVSKIVNAPSPYPPLTVRVAAAEFWATHERPPVR